MKKNVLSFFLLLLGSLLLYNCSDNDDSDSFNNTSKFQIHNFIWNGLNTYYLWQAEVPNLSDTKFKTQSELDTYFSGFATPENLFENLLYNPGTTDRFSVLFADYVKLEQALTGTTASNGVEMGFSYKSGSTTDIFGWVKYIMPNSDASAKNIQRGTIFYGINGTPLTISNYHSLLANTTYTLNLADYDGGNITPKGQSVKLTKMDYSENPVLITNVHTVGANKVGYLMYNGFYTDYESQLNNAFATLKSQNVTHLVLDLRYNSGGSVATATRLASMITGQFPGQVFAKQQWNAKIMAATDPNNLINNFRTTISTGVAINSLNLSRVYILTTKSTASASELIINCLKPYIDVVQIGKTTTGKNVGSVTLYDSPNFAKQNINPYHRYAMQPIVLKIVDKNGFGDYTSGIIPEVHLDENPANLGVLGDAAEPYLAKALEMINNGGRWQAPKPFKTFEDVKITSKRNLQEEMYLDEVPEDILKLL